MKIGCAICLILAQSMLICGCGENGKTKLEGRDSPEVVSTSSFSNEVVMAVAEIKRGFATFPNVITNGARVRNVACDIRGKIFKLPLALSEQYGREMARTIASVPIDHLGNYDQFRARVAMFHMLNEVGWRGIKTDDVWELRLQCLKRLREAIESVHKEEIDQRNRHHVEYVVADLSWYSEFWEKELAYRVSKSIPPRDHAWMVKKIPEEEYLAIRKRFEEFLGRSIRSYEEIIRAKRERDRQMNLEEERRKAGPGPDPSDVKVDIGNL